MKKSKILLSFMVCGIIFSKMSFAEDIERGQFLYKNCAQCHGDHAQGNELVKAPQLAGLTRQYMVQQIKHFQSGMRGAHPDDVAGLKMRPMSRTLRNEEDIKSISDYITSLKEVSPPHGLTGGDVEKGKAAYMVCAACHGPDAKGNESLSSPALRTLNDWYILQQLKNFKAGIRGTDPKDAGGSIMRPMALGLDEETMLNIIAYIKTIQ